jgi:hypothetical protein
MKSVQLLGFLLLFVEFEDESLLDEMSKSELDSTSLLLFDLLEDAVLLDLRYALFCLLFLECLVFGEDASLLDEMSESELDSTSLLLICLLEEAVLLDWSCALLCLLVLEFLVLGLFSLLFLEDLVFGQNLSLKMSSGANPSDCALSNADAIFSFIILDKQLL